MAPIIEFINIFTINGGKGQVDFLPHFHRFMFMLKALMI